MDLDTALLRAFVCLEEERHFGKAAARLVISQQALSKRVARLERIVGTQLFDRAQHPLQLTPPGEALLPFARDAVEAVDAAATSVGLGPAVRVDVMDEHSAAAGLVSAAVARHPELRVHTSARGDNGPASDALLAGRVDIAFGRPASSPWPRDLRKRPALAEPIGLLVASGHELASRSSVSMAEVATTPLSFPMRGAPQEWVDFVAALELDFGLGINAEGCSVNFDHFVDHPAQHVGCASLFGMAMRVPAGRGVTVVPIVTPTPVFVWSVMWRKRVPESVVDTIAPEGAVTLPHDAWVPSLDR